MQDAVEGGTNQARSSVNEQMWEDAGTTQFQFPTLTAVSSFHNSNAWV